MEAYFMWERVHLAEDMGRPCSSCDCTFENTVFSNLGHLWMFGPLCICTAIMIGIRNVLYLRRRRVIDMVLRQQIEDLRSQQSQLAESQQYTMPIRTVSEITLPPAYDQLDCNNIQEGNEIPPPSYDEATVNMPKHTLRNDNILVHDYSVK
ncbi:uncharacterized protein LOC126905679 isoform X2 [Daktulosphaira vitifoliae]|uniref:uncharacterized protein LOC126905679 isoform X2 n=1 Tax=Daktulosphaira vitifoliae TaxID=58002 RepID=UPI0021AA7101|nr:uncharacterized protein LOC126905679 isoform X2 [Daktulosphaira vitifoliae]